MKIMYAVAASAAFVLSTQADAGLSNFLMTNGAGTLYEVNGSTLETTQVGQIQDAFSINEIQYVGNSEILVNTTGGMDRYNLNTGVQTTEFLNADVITGPGFAHWSQGAALTSDGDIFFAVTSFLDMGRRTFGAKYDPTTGTVTEMAEHANGPDGLYFDFHEVGPDLYAAVEQTGQSLRIVDAITGDNVALYDTGINNASFVSLDGSLFVVTTEGDMFDFDANDGSLDFYGSITGFSSNLLGVTNIPAPSGSLLLMIATGFASKRRR